MQITLKNVKVSAHLSQETTAFTATIFVDGVRAGSATNQGHGGNTRVWIDAPGLAKAVDDWAKSQPPIQYPALHGAAAFSVPCNLEQMVDALLDAHLAALDEQKHQKKMAKLCAGGVVFRFKTDPQGPLDPWRYVKTARGETMQGTRDYVAKKYGDKIGMILNDNPGMA